MLRLERHDIGLRLLKRSQILRLLGRNIRLINAPVLVAVLILPVENALRIVLPNKIADTALAIIGDHAVVRLAQRAHPDIQNALIRGKIGEHGPVG